MLAIRLCHSILALASLVYPQGSGTSPYDYNGGIAMRYPNTTCPTGSYWAGTSFMPSCCPLGTYPSPNGGIEGFCCPTEEDCESTVTSHVKCADPAWEYCPSPNNNALGFCCLGGWVCYEQFYTTIISDATTTISSLYVSRDSTGYKPTTPKSSSHVPDQIMAPPTREEVYHMFKNLENPNGGIEKFFESFSPDVKYTVPGHGRFAGYYPRKEDYYNATWAKFRQILKPPGFTFHITNGLDGVITGQDGWAVVIMETRDTYTLSGVKYDQHYSWHCKFNDEKLVVECRAYLDLGYLEDILGTEMKKQGIP